MTEISLIAMALFTLSSVSAQFVSGDKYLTGTIGFNSSKITSDPNAEVKSSGFEFSPAFIRFRSDNKAIGFRLLSGYSHAETSSGTNHEDSKHYNIGAGIFAQRYFSLGNRFYFLVEPGISLAYGSTKNTQSAFAVTTTENKIYGARVYITPAIGYKLTNRLIMNLNFTNMLALSYTHQKSETKVANTTSASRSNAYAFQSSLNNTSVGNLGITFGYRLK